MKNLLTVLAVLMFANCFSFTGRALAQGPAGVGAAEAAGGGSSSTRSYNPMKLFARKDAKPVAPAISVEELDKRLEPKLRASQILAPTATLKDACVNFVERADCLAVLHASHTLALDFDCLKSNFTGVRVATDTSACRMPAGDKPLNLAKSIHLLKPDADYKNAAKDAEASARDDVRDASTGS